MAQRVLEISKVLTALDKKDFLFYSNLSDEDKKLYSPFILMHYMSSLTDQNNMGVYAVLATNDLINLGFWNLSKHPELLHLLLCVVGIKGKQYRPWLITKKNKISNKIDTWLLEQHSELNEIELQIIKDQYDLKSWTELIKSSGIDDAKIKELITAWKNK